MSVHLDPDLKALMTADLSVAVLWQDEIEGQTALLAKATDEDVASFRGKVPIQTRWELGRFASGSVLRLVLTIFDQPDRPYTFETFINVASPEQRACVEQLLKQDKLHLHFFDSRADYALTKVIGHPRHWYEHLKPLIVQAVQDRETIGLAWDFEGAKALFQARRPM